MKVLIKLFQKFAQVEGAKPSEKYAKHTGSRLRLQRPADVETPLSFQSARGGEFPKERGGTTSGVPPDKEYTALVLAVTTVNFPNPFVPLFLLAKKAQKKKLGKKKYAVRRVSRSAERDLGRCPKNPQTF